MKTRMLLFFLVFAGIVVLASPGYPGALVAQPNAALSGDGKPDDWGAPSHSRSTVASRPTDWESARTAYRPEGRPEDWGSPVASAISTQGKPEDWGSPSLSFWSIQGKPEDWDSPLPWFLGSILNLFIFR